MRFNKVQDWLDWQESLHHKEIDLGLDRVRKVADKLGIHISCPVITVAGTNGKGSTVAFLKTILQASGQQVACYTSPHIHRYHERIVINDKQVDDDQLLSAFAAIDDARDDVSLSYFEFGTLAALWLFMQASPDVVILEVGLGGRLDAVNIIDADLAIITHIALDHMDWLGENLDLIAREKAGIGRQGQPMVLADTEAPASLLEAVKEKAVISLQAGKDYHYEIHSGSWDWHMGNLSYLNLPMPAMPGTHQIQNAAGALAALSRLPKEIRPSEQAVHEGLKRVSLAGRFEQLSAQPMILFDVAHNPDSIEVLAKLLVEQPVSGDTHLLISVMRDKDAAGMVGYLQPYVDHWHISAANIERAMPVQDLARIVRDLIPNARISISENLTSAYESASKQLQTDDRLIVTGSFFTVAEVRALLL